MHNLIDWHVENKVQGARERYELAMNWSDALVPALAMSIVPILIILTVMTRG